MTEEVTNIDERGTFKGNDEQLCNCIEALIELNDKRATTPPVPAMAVSLLLAASDRLTAAQSEADDLRKRVNVLEAHLTEAIERVEAGDLDKRMCCDGHMCGCMGSTNADQFLHYARQALAGQP